MSTQSSAQSENLLVLRHLELKVMAGELALISKRLSPTPSLSHIALIEEELARARGEHARVWRDIEFHNALAEDERRNGRNERFWLGLLTATGLGVAVLAITSNRSRS